MQNYNQLISFINQLNDQASAYTLRSSKAESKRMRASMNEIKKLITPAKTDLLTADKG